MASAWLSSSALTLSKPLAPSNSSSHTPRTFLNSKNHIRISQIRRSPSPWRRTFAVKSEFDLTFFERDLQDSDVPPQSAIPGQGFPDVEDKEEPQTPPGLRKYESMVVLRPDMSEDERLAFTQKYEEDRRMFDNTIRFCIYLLIRASNSTRQRQKWLPLMKEFSNFRRLFVMAGMDFS
ncbi:small ribosomal subunit protein bS6c-like isoform X2 [Primulina eburnea]|uniref:small ribosomal subunit protein bS6c-like isoform X2 n=1 Tax=Primulina eburnea TaxID=1245227 RepID=UPI003C6BF97F